jgi:hypothetical protein
MTQTRPPPLPPHPPGRLGFPWDTAAFVPPNLDPHAGSWPRITVVTPSFNQARFLEAAIRSVLLQGYPNLEYIVVDGGSRDGSIGILQKYSPWLSHWSTEPDRGQVHALEKSLGRATGEFFNWINSDDLLAPGALFRVAQAAARGADLVAGVCLNFDSTRRRSLIANARLNAADLVLDRGQVTFHQPALWWRRDWIAQCGGLDERFDLAFDYDLLLRYLALDPVIAYTQDVLAWFRLHPASKTCSQAAGFDPDRERVLEKLANQDEFPGLVAPCRRRLDQLRWWRDVARLRDATGPGAFGRAVSLAIQACADPRTRLNRFTLGALRRILFAE